MKHSIFIVTWSFFVLALIFFAYEFYIVKNPFFDPIPGSVIWGVCLILLGFWIFRLGKARSSK